MPSTSTLSVDDKAKVKTSVPVSVYKIHYAALVRIYYAYPEPNKWSYAGLQGALVLASNNQKNSMHFKLVDIDGTRGVIWEHEVYDGFELHQDRPYFHSFTGDKCMIAFVYADESEAKTLRKKFASKKSGKASKPKSEKKKKAANGGKITTSMISAPQTGSFIHVAHMGYDAESGFTSKGVDPSWTALLSNLESSLGRDVVEREMEFIKKFVREHPQEAHKAAAKGPKPPPPPRRPPNGNSSISTPTAPPPPPPTRKAVPHPPSRPPAPPSRPQPAAQDAPRIPEPPSVPPAPPRRPVQHHVPPPPPARPTSHAPAVPPPPPRPSTGPSRPPPPPVRPHHRGPSADGADVAPPPPPPPPPTAPPAPPAPPIGAPPPPPPPPHVQSSIPAAPAGHNDLLASIQGKGVHNLRKVDPSSQNIRDSVPGATTAGSAATGAAVGAGAGVAAAAAASSAGGGGADLTTALAAALLERNKRLGDSDDDDDDDDDWD